MKVSLPRRAARTAALFCALTSIAVTVLVGRLSIASHIPFAPLGVPTKALLHVNNLPAHSWRAIHVLAAGCRCSRRVARYLASRGPLPGIHEAVLLVGVDDKLAQLLAPSKLSWKVVTPTQSSEEYHIEGVPLLLIIDPSDVLKYAGGYATDRNTTNGYQDVAIWHSLSSGLNPPNLPILGCPAGQRVKKSLITTF